MKDLYTARVRVTGGRDGRAVADDQQLDVKLALPKAIGGSGQGANPEQLFAAGFAACFTSSIKHAAQQLGFNAGDVAIDSNATLTVSDDGRYGLKVALGVATPGLDAGAREQVLTEAKRICAYTNATRGNVDVVIS